jgi:hypothetical protein
MVVEAEVPALLETIQSVMVVQDQLVLLQDRQ